MKTTNKDFQLFKSECEKWLKRFELGGWKVYFTHQAHSQDTFATCYSNTLGRNATIYFTDEWDDEIRKLTPEAVKETAKHEMIHLLLARLSDNGRARYVVIDEIDEAEEELVRKLENII